MYILYTYIYVQNQKAQRNTKIASDSNEFNNECLNGGTSLQCLQIGQLFLSVLSEFFFFFGMDFTSLFLSLLLSTLVSILFIHLIFFSPFTHLFFSLGSVRAGPIIVHFFWAIQTCSLHSNNNEMKPASTIKTVYICMNSSNVIVVMHILLYFYFIHTQLT